MCYSFTTLAVIKPYEFITRISWMNKKQRRKETFFLPHVDAFAKKNVNA